MSTHDTTHIPEGWRETTLGEVIGILDGDRGSNYTNGDDFSDDGFCLFLNTKNVPNTKFSFSEKMFITEEKDKQLRKGKLQRGDYIMTTRLTIGNFAYYNQKVPFDHIRINSGMVILRADKNNVDEVFFGQYLDSILFRYQFTSLQSGSAVPQLPIRDIKTFSILLPPLPEQRAIADILSSFDAKIDLLKEQNEALEKMAQTIFQRWFGRYSVESPEELPEGWRIGKLGEVAKLIAGGDSPKNTTVNKTDTNTIPVFSNGISNDGLYGYTDIPRIMEESVTVSARGTIGYVSLKIEPYVPIVRLIAIIPNKTYISSKYLFLWLKNQNISGTGTTQQQITIPSFSNQEIIIPESDIMDDFTKLLESFYEKIFTNTSQIQSLSKTRDELLPKLMNGEVRVV